MLKPGLKEMVLLPILERASCRCAAVLGTVKNAGKTVTLNTLVAEAGAAGIRIGITSSGRDGERTDTVYGHDKPPVRLPSGTLILTYDWFAGDGDRLISPLEVLGRHPRYGRLILAEMKSAGEIVLAGPVTRASMTAGLETLTRAGAGLVLVDGSMDRRGFIDTGLVKSLILATGMALSQYPEEVAQKTAHIVEILRLPLWRGELPGNNAFYLDHRWVPLKAGMVLGDEKRLVREIPGEALAIYLGGALTDRLLLAMGEEKKYPIIVLKDPFACFAGREAYLPYLGAGGDIRVKSRPELLAVTTNPWGHGGCGDPLKLAGAVKEAVPDLPVVDVVRKMVF